MKHEETTDGLFHQRLFNAEVPPPPSVWRGVEAELRRRKRRIFWWWTSAGMVGTALLLAGWWWNETATSCDQPASVPSVAPIAAPNHTVSSTPAVHRPGVIHQTQPAPRATIPQTVQSWKTAAIGSPNATPKVSSPILQQPQEEALLDENYIVSTQNASKKAEGANSTSPIKSSKSVKAYTLSFSTAFLPVGINALERAFPTPAFKKWPTRIIRKKKEKEDKCYNFEEHRNVWMLDAYAGPVLAQKQLHNNGSPEYDQYLRLRLQTEGPGWGFNGGIRASVLFNKNYVVSAGLEYEQFTEVFKYVDPTSIEYIIKQVHDVSTGQWTIDTTIHFAAKITQIHNRLGRIDIPLTVGYEIRQQRSGVRLMAGGAMNLYFWKRGAILDPVTGEPGYFTPGKGTQTVFRANAGLSVQGSAQFFWHPERRTRLFAEPYYRLMLQSVTAPGHPLQQQYRIWGLRLGATSIF